MIGRMGKKIIVSCYVNVCRVNFPFGTIIGYCIVLYCIVLYCIVLYCIVLYCIVLYCMVSYRIVSYPIIIDNLALKWLTLTQKYRHL